MNDESGMICSCYCGEIDPQLSHELPATTAYLVEADLLSTLAETTTAHQEVVLADQSVVVEAHTAERSRCEQWFGWCEV